MQSYLTGYINHPFGNMQLERLKEVSIRDKTYEARETEINQSNAGTVRPNVNASVRRRNFDTGNRKVFSSGERCIEMAIARPFRRVAEVWAVVTRRYRRCRGKIKVNAECTM